MGLDIHFCCDNCKYYNSNCDYCGSLGFRNPRVRIVDYFPHPNFNIRTFDGYSVRELIVELQRHSIWINDNMNKFEYPKIILKDTKYNESVFQQYWQDYRSLDEVNLDTDYIILIELIAEIINFARENNGYDYIVEMDF